MGLGSKPFSWYEELRQKYGNSFYVFDRNQFINNICRLKDVFGVKHSCFHFAYSYKTNYIPELIRIVNSYGGYAEVVSSFEKEVALNNGVEFKDIIWNGPVKRKKDMEVFLLNGGMLHIDNFAEANKVINIAVDNPNKVLSVGLRCNYDVSDGVISRFGFDVGSGEFDEVFCRLRGIDNIQIKSLHCHFAKRDLEYWENRVQGMVDLCKRLNEQYGFCPKIIDLGGGLYGEMPADLAQQITSNPPSLEDYAELIAKHLEKTGISDYELVIEPGSALVANCFTYVARVDSIKRVRGHRIATVCGSQKNISMQGVVPPISIINSTEGLEYGSVDITGYTCIESDYFAKDYYCRIAEGDYLVVSNCGSYSVVMKPPFIEPNVPVLMMEDDEVSVIKRAETIEDIMGSYDPED